MISRNIFWIGGLTALVGLFTAAGISRLREPTSDIEKSDCRTVPLRFPDGTTQERRLCNPPGTEPLPLSVDVYERTQASDPKDHFVYVGNYGRFGLRGRAGYGDPECSKFLTSQIRAKDQQCIYELRRLKDGWLGVTVDTDVSPNSAELSCNTYAYDGKYERANPLNGDCNQKWGNFPDASINIGYSDEELEYLKRSFHISE